MSSLHRLYGHAELRQRLARAARAGTLASSLLLHGPPGVGKQRLGLWLARRLVCTAGDGGEPCGDCRACRLALRVEHPDIHWFFPLPRPRRSGGLDKMIEALEDARAEALAERRAHPLRASVPAGPVGIYLAQVHAIRRLTAARPAMADRQVLLVGDAELMVPQEASTEAANAFLKLLEEPPRDTTFVLTTANPDALLPTIRSRLQHVRVSALPDADVIRFLRTEGDVDDDTARRIARLARGSIGRALGFLPRDGEPGPLESLRADARALLRAATAPDPLDRYALAHARSPAGARGEFHDSLDFLDLWIRDLAAVASGADETIANADAADWLADLARRLPVPAAGAPDALRATARARALARGNVNPQLTTAWLLRALRHTLDPTSPAPRRTATGV